MSFNDSAHGLAHQLVEPNASTLDEEAELVAEEVVADDGESDAGPLGPEERAIRIQSPHRRRRRRWEDVTES